MKLEAARAGVRVLAANAGVLAQVTGDLAGLGRAGPVAARAHTGKVLNSAQAVELTMEETEPVTRVRAAADIGAEVLAEVAGFWARAGDIAREGLARLEAGAGAAGERRMPRQATGSRSSSDNRRIGVVFGVGLDLLGVF